MPVAAWEVTVCAVTAAFSRAGGRGTGPGHAAGGVGEGREQNMSGGPGQRCLLGPALPCPCCIRRAEHTHATVRRRILAALAVTGLAALAGLCLFAGPVQAAVPADPPAAGASGAARIALIAVAALAVTVFTVLQVLARARCRRARTYTNWRTWPP